MVITLLLITVIIAAVYWVKGITQMHNEHPDYDGMDMFDED